MNRAERSIGKCSEVGGLHVHIHICEWHCVRNFVTCMYNIRMVVLNTPPRKTS